jgi:AAA family ATP:ADP antiporter
VSTPLRAVLDIRRDELPFALSMFGYFFLVITSFWILKPIKKAVFIQYYNIGGFDFFGWLLSAPQAELLAKALNMLVAVLAVIVFSRLSRDLRRQQLTLVFSLFFIAGYALYSQLLTEPGQWTVWSFYLYGDLFATLMVTTFFAFLNDSVSADSAKRLYGLIGLGGVAGGVFGSSFVRLWIDRVSYDQWLWICLGIALVIVTLALYAGRLVSRHPPVPVEPAPEIAQAKKSENAALAGAKLVFSSPYLLSIVAIVGLYEIVSTIVDFQFTSTIAHYLEGPAIGKQFSTVFAITNWVALVVQLFLTSYIMTRFGLKTALLVLPLVILFGSAAFVALPILWIGSLLNTADNGFSYSINQSAKETLYVPTTREEKYQAKAFIDMFVQRFAKAVAVLISLGITAWFNDFESLRYLSGVVIVMIGLWMWAAVYAGKHFEEKSG